MTTTTVPRSTAAQTRRAIWNTIRGSSGNLVEWYDVYVYTVFATYFEGQFFDESEKNSTVYVYAIFAITFVMRPVGSWFFGRYADRHGRRAALTVSVSLMALCSLMIALVPSQAVIGMAAPIILVVARLVQGFATGGEYGTSATYMSEAATRERRGFFSSFQYVTLIGGHVLAQFTLLILQSFLSDDQMREFGWRIAFAIGGVAAVVVFWLRRTMDESLSEDVIEAAKAGQDSGAGSMRTLVTQYRRPLLLCFLITLGGTVAFYTYS
ncbi:MAG: MFS transporter, partial [Mycolicibacterium aromaticivorans]|nr:MFS transporter [Mycolicibacterium aromaticivorans]